VWWRFSEAQATCIQYQLEAIRRERRDLDGYFHDSRLDGFFIKNLESVQGDERDIIIFSIGFGRDENDKFTMNFGPVGQEGGYRRLNVAITRARNRVEVISSVRASDFKDTANVNINHLRGYLDFAERGMAALTPITAGEGEPESPFEVAVLDVVRGWGYQVEPQVGHAGYRIDMAIRHPEKQGSWLLGIECDGAAYHSTRTARDRDRLRQEVLEGLGWNLHRIWGPAWYHDQRGCETRLRDAIADALSGATDRPRPRSTQFEVDIEEVDTSLTALPEWVVPYIAAQGEPYSRPMFATLSSPRATAAFLPDVLNIVSIEGPVHRDIVVDRLRLPFGAERTRSTFRTAVNVAINQLVRGGQILDSKEGFLATPSNVPGESVRVRFPSPDYPQTLRTVEQVPPSEIRQAMINLVHDAHAIDEGELFVRVARIFGWARNGAVITRILAAQLELLIRRQLLDKREGRISTV
jgi:very-short-patch-repair endonuclease